MRLLSEGAPARGRPGARPVRITLWFETLAAAEHLADEFLSDDEGGDESVPESVPLDDTELQGALEPLHVSAALPRGGDDVGIA